MSLQRHHELANPGQSYLTSDARLAHVVRMTSHTVCLFCAGLP